MPPADPDTARQDAALWRPDGVRRTLGAPAGAAGTVPSGINTAATVVGYTWSGIPAREYQQAVRWSPDGTPTVLPLAGGEQYAAALFVNDAGLVAGVQLLHGGAMYASHLAVVWRP
ncbi:hypothetical protein GCM10010495_78910 [Kitasatospora herbaricolor]|uniref:hypothetical protein n=1 Tax=Kitasatospora herbaricolor TaxID=68217 RepID=UPI00174A51BB|nr:hypothetical protein [Kitasatospora herbaricolor]MDQ0306163.1 hypothetical protein [Kitasatospora herbaricolor]GGV49412.1 hypothetical protein GCM10010495_78910 [Kitasatospora herbaricolor]